MYVSDDMESKDNPKKNRVLPQWMLDPENHFKKSNPPKKKKIEEPMPVTYVMSPYELEQVARNILSEAAAQQ